MGSRYISKREEALADLKKLFLKRPDMDAVREALIADEIFVGYGLDYKWIKEALDAMVRTGRAKRVS